MVSTASKTSRLPIPVEPRAADFRAPPRRKGVTDLARNGGKRPTPGRRALLEAIEAAGGKW